MSGKPHANPFCELMAGCNRTCAACLDLKYLLNTSCWWLTRSPYKRRALNHPWSVEPEPKSSDATRSPLS